MARLSLEEILNPEPMAGDIDPVDNQEQIQNKVAVELKDSEATQDDLERSIDLAESMESIRETLSSGNKWTPTEMRLASIATEMAVAGTGVPGTYFMPALESADPKIAMEGFGERVMAVIKRLGATITGLWDKMRDILSSIADAFRGYIGQIESIESRLGVVEHSGCSVFTAKKIKSFGAAVRADGSMAKDFKEVTARYKAVSRTMTGMVESFDKQVVVIARGYGKWQLFKDLTDVEKAGKMFFENTVSAGKAIVGSAKFARNESGGVEIWKSEVFPGGNSITVTMPSKNLYSSGEYSEMKEAVKKFGVDYDALTAFDRAVKSGEDIGDLTLNVDSPITIKDVREYLANLKDLIHDQRAAWRRLSQVYINEQTELQGVIRAMEKLVLVPVALMSPGLHTSSSVLNLATGVGKIYAAHTLSPTQMLLSSFRIMAKNNDMIRGGIEGIYFSIAEAITTGLSLGRYMVARTRWSKA